MATDTATPRTGYGQDSVTGPGATVSVPTNFEARIHEILPETQQLVRLLGAMNEQQKITLDLLGTHAERVKILANEYSAIPKLQNEVNAAVKELDSDLGGTAEGLTASTKAKAALTQIATELGQLQRGGAAQPGQAPGAQVVQQQVVQQQVVTSGGPQPGVGAPEPATAGPSAPRAGGALPNEDAFAQVFNARNVLSDITQGYTSQMFGSLNRGGPMTQAILPRIQQYLSPSHRILTGLLPGRPGTPGSPAIPGTAPTSVQGQLPGMEDTAVAEGGQGILPGLEAGAPTAAAATEGAAAVAPEAAVAAGIPALAVAAPLAAGYAAFRGISGAIETAGTYSKMTGGTSVAEAMGYEARIRMMSLSPFLSSDQARQIVYTTLQVGYQGNRAETIMDYIASNVKSGVLDVGQSMQLYQTAVGEGKATTDQLRTSIEFMDVTAQRTNASIKDLGNALVTITQSQIALGAGPAAAGIASLWATSYANSANPVLQQQGGNLNFNSPESQGLLATQLGVSPDQVFATMHTLPPAQQEASQQNVVRTTIDMILGPGDKSNLTLQDIRENPMIGSGQAGAFFEQSIGLPPQIAQDREALSQWIYGQTSGKNTIEAARQRQAEQFGNQSVFDPRNRTRLMGWIGGGPNTPSPLNATVNTPAEARQFLAQHRGDYEFWRSRELGGPANAQGLRQWYQAEALRRDQRSPLVEQLLARNPQDIFVRGGMTNNQARPLTEVYQNHPEELWRNLTSGSLQVGRGTEEGGHWYNAGILPGGPHAVRPGPGHWSDSLAQMMGVGQDVAQGGARVNVGFTGYAERMLKQVDPYGAAGWDTAAGASSVQRPMTPTTSPEVPGAIGAGG